MSPLSPLPLPLSWPRWLLKCGLRNGSSGERRVHPGHGAEAAADGVHQAPDPRAGEGVPLQPVPDAEEADRDSARALPVGTANQNLVPEPADEVEEGQQAAQHQEREEEEQARAGPCQQRHLRQQQQQQQRVQPGQQQPGPDAAVALCRPSSNLFACPKSAQQHGLIAGVRRADDVPNVPAAVTNVLWGRAQN